MTPWQQIFESQRLIGRTTDAIDALQTLTTENLDETGLGQLCRLQKALPFIRGRLKAIDPELVSQSSLNNLGSWLTNLANHVQNFASSGNVAHLTNANATVDSVIDVVRSFRVTPKSDEQAIGLSTAAFRDKAIEEIERVRESRKEAMTELAGLKRELTLSKTALDQNNRVIENQKSRLDQSIADFQQQFSASEAKRATDFQTSLTKLSDDTSDQIVTFTERFESDRKERLKEAATIDAENKARDTQYFDFLKERQNEVNQIFGAIGSASLAGHFRKTADEQRDAANRFRLIALALMLLMVGMAATTFYLTLGSVTADWHLFAFRFTTSVILVIPALYAAQESAKHRDRERRLRKSDLELASIDAYLALLPGDKRDELKEKLADKFFGQSDSVEKTETVTGHSLVHLLEIVLKNLTAGK